MPTTEQFRAIAAEYGELIKATTEPGTVREFRKLERSFVDLANNQDGPADNLDKAVRTNEEDGERVARLAEDEDQVLRCLGAAVINQWNTLPKKLQKELFDSASSVGDLLQTDALKGQIARFLHNHKDD
jgi:hypothetical protein